jgi:hypothetical protein
LLATLWPEKEQELRASYPNLDEATLAELRGAFAATLNTKVAEVMRAKPLFYARRFSAEELRELIAFYHTRAGQRVLQESPRVTNEALQSMLPRLDAVRTEADEVAHAILRRRGFQ